MCIVEYNFDLTENLTLSGDAAFINVTYHISTKLANYIFLQIFNEIFLPSKTQERYQNLKYHYKQLQKYKAEICSRKGNISYAIFMTALKAEISTYITKYRK